jgi:fido (protein-threonine AMPylation protein)
MKPSSLRRLEVKNLKAATALALTYIITRKVVKLRFPKSFLLTIHKTLLAHKPKIAGRYRNATDEINVNEATFKYAEPWEIEFKVTELFEELANRHKIPAKFRKLFLRKVRFASAPPNELKKFLYIIFLSWYYHHKLVVIHPFCDGNGRISRLMMCLILRERGLSTGSYPVLINYYIRKNRNKYLNALNAADDGDFIPGILFMSNVLVKSYKKTTGLLRNASGQMKLF